MMNNVDIVLETLINQKIIPESGIFEINDWLIDTYCHIYKNISKKDLKTGYKQNKPSNKRYTRKMAGVVLNRLLAKRLPVVVITHESKLYNNTKSGFVYVLTNPAFEGYYKVGMTTDLNKRLNTYQTYDPLRRYKIHHNVFVTNRREAEKKILESFEVDLVRGEWVKADTLKELFKALIAFSK